MKRMGRGGSWCPGSKLQLYEWRRVRNGARRDRSERPLSSGGTCTHGSRFPITWGWPALTDWRERQVGNEALARDINEIEDGALEHRGGSATNRYVCECSDASCSATISLTQGEYEQVRADGARFVIALDHENPEIDLLVA